MNIYYYSGTHWDREWYQCFQGFRKRLVDMIDGLIKGLEEMPDYGIFHFDGQTIVLEDYLEIRPEMRGRLEALIKKGKILIGPWYDMPDEFLVSGESLIKNLRVGMDISRSWGVEPCKNAYICDIFGHSSQTPQIFAGMGLYHTVLGRGTNEHEDPKNFIWQALDGSEVMTFRLNDRDGYGDFSGYANRNKLDEKTDEELDELIKAYIDEEMSKSNLPDLLIMDAIDHMPLRASTPRILASMRRVYPEANVYHCSIEEFNRRQSEQKDKLEVRRGEICRPAKQKFGFIHVITNTLSSRYPLKRYNDMNQTTLEKWAAPLYAFHMTDMSEGFLRLADRYLLKNHPHDSICGCSIDQVHRDMMYRFDQTRLICDEIMNPFKKALAGDLSAYEITPVEEAEGIRLRVFNPLPYRTRRTVTAKVDLSSLPTYSEPFGYEKIPAFRMYDAKGDEVPYGYVGEGLKKVYEISFESELSPCGVTEFYLCPSKTPTRYPVKLLRGVTCAEGDLVSVSVNSDGTVDMTDRRTGEVYKNLLTLVDDGEIGDGWYHCCPNIDKVVTQTAADVQVIENSAVRTTFRITQKMMLPDHVDKLPVIKRSDDLVEFKVVHDVTVAKGDAGITVHTVIDNNVKDHRLRLRLPSVVDGDTYEAAQAFGYVSRKCGEDTSTADWREYGWAERNMAGICAKRKGNRGLAFVSAYGLHECGVWENGDMDITLFRAFSKTVGTHGEPDGELLERLEFSYKIISFGEKDSFASLAREQDFLSAGICSATSTSGSKARVYRSMIEVEGEDIVYSTANLLPDGASEIRVFNDSEKFAPAKITLPYGAHDTTMVELDGRHVCDLEIKDGAVEFTLPAFRIATVKFFM